jgi:phage tail tape-measure protein
MISDRGIDVLGILSDKLNLGKDDIAEFGKTAEGAAEMVQALIAGLNEKFGGAMESKMDNLSTKTSNMVIAFKQLGDELFKSGLGDFLKNMADRLTQLANAITKAVRAAGGRATVADVTGESDVKAQQKRLEILIAGQEAKLRIYSC